MEGLLAVAVGVLAATGTFLLLQRSMIRLVIGLAILSNAVNLLIFTAGRLTRGKAPIIPQGESALSGAFANPVSQALILTAIVISFGLFAFSLALAYRAHADFDSLDLDELTASTCRPGEDEE